MMKRLACFLALTLIAAACSISYAETYKPRVAVYGFESKASSGFWHDAKWSIGTGMGEMLVDALVNTGKFEVMERLNLRDITTEQDLVTGGRISKKTGAKTGKIKGAEYIVRGTITEFDVRDAGGNLGLTIKGFRIGGKVRSAHVGGIIRIYDATTGTIYDSKRFEKKVPATGLSFGHSGGDVGISLGAFKKTPLGKATHIAIADMVEFISSSIPAEPRVEEITCDKCSATVAAGEQYCPKCGADLSVRTPDFCPRCGEEIAPGVTYCPGCGLQVTGLLCPECGKELPAGTNFCPGCGTKVKK
jgi:curli biogenesis system outer membrane secretion channel CsgG